MPHRDHIRLVSEGQAEPKNPVVVKELVTLLEKMLEHAKSGELVGMIGVPMWNDHRYSMIFEGHWYLYPTYALGAAGRMWKRINDMIEQDENQSTRVGA